MNIREQHNTTMNSKTKDNLLVSRIPSVFVLDVSDLVLGQFSTESRFEACPQVFDRLAMDKSNQDEPNLALGVLGNSSHYEYFFNSRQLFLLLVTDDIRSRRSKRCKTKEVRACPRQVFMLQRLLLSIETRRLVEESFSSTMATFLCDF